MPEKPSRSGAVRAVIGVPTYNHAHKLREALESLLSQTCGNFRIIVSDDNSIDETPDILAAYAKVDDRLIYRRTGRRLGYIGNARRCFELARELFPEAEFFAWGSDHDIWHPLWLEALLVALEHNPDAVIACPRSYRIDADGTILAIKSLELNTIGISDRLERFRTTFKGMSAGNMIYGLIRSDALERAGVLRWHLLPDRLLLAELSLYGATVTVPEYLWFRRYRGIASIDRQISASFFQDRPFYLRLPWWIAHSGFLFRHYVVEPEADAPLDRIQGSKLALLYLLHGAKLVFLRSLMRKVRVPLRMAANIVRPAAYRVRDLVRSVPGRPYRVFRPIYAPILGIVFRRQKG